MVRVTNYFDTQVRVPATTELGIENSQRQRLSEYGIKPRARKMTDEQLTTWYGKILDSVRLRHRKLQRFARFVLYLFKIVKILTSIVLGC